LSDLVQRLERTWAEYEKYMEDTEKFVEDLLRERGRDKLSLATLFLVEYPQFSIRELYMKYVLAPLIASFVLMVIYVLGLLPVDIVVPTVFALHLLTSWVMYFVLAKCWNLGVRFGFLFMTVLKKVKQR